MNNDELRHFCLSLRGTTEDIKWGADLCFCIGGKMYCVTGRDTESHVSFKVLEEEFDELCGRPGIIPAPYMARNKWIAVEDRNALTRREWEHYVKQSYELVAAKLPVKLKKALGLL